MSGPRPQRRRDGWACPRCGFAPETHGHGHPPATPEATRAAASAIVLERVKEARRAAKRRRGWIGSMERTPKIAVVDDHRLFSSGFSLVLAAPPVSAEVTIFDAPDPLLSHAPGPARWDVIALDMFIPGYEPERTIGAVARRWPEAALLVVSGSRSPGDEAACLAAGAAAFLSKTVEPDRLRDCVMGLLGRGDGAAAASSPGAIAEAAAAGGLSARQLEIVLLAAEGLSNKEIAAAIDVSPETVKTHLAAVFQKLGVRNRMEAIEAARGRGLV